MYFTLDPENFKERTHVYKGSAPTPQEKSMGIRDDKKDLPVYMDGVSTISCWKTTSLKARIWFLLKGKIWLQVYGKQPQSVGMGIGQMFSVKSFQEDTTNEEH